MTEVGNKFESSRGPETAPEIARGRIPLPDPAANRHNGVTMFSALFLICLAGAALASRNMVSSRTIGSASDVVLESGWLFGRILAAAALAWAVMLAPFLLMS